MLHKIRGKRLSYNWSDGAARDYFHKKCDTFYESLSFNVDETITYNTPHTRFKLTNCYISSTGVAFGESCVMDVCFDTAWFLNGIDKHSKRIVLNNIEQDEMQLVVDEQKNCIILKEVQLTEEWLFQLMTLYDIPSYSDILIFKEIREHMMQYSYPMSFSVSYNNVNHLDLFFEKIHGYLEELI
ncbi:hypothetical protein GAP32_054 [Cronobacter phage vB_CsaM_GAP32]|uniref:Uncharacterized protein n=1 Tax=Cronobacter phage vB_CsaM_GAP32 TaxID=1141136 RepID=K4F760_9CAUD|nr:hypothetical protein GAP32_054 [Cronobacter phage vB_CsaM_GAP32]AFC21502.1 hypothetical protein GAP32_054 [Cronobacter phage vB_CsaM_GAP32]